MTVNALPSTEALRPPRGGDRPPGAVESASFMISPPCTLPSRLAWVELVMVASDTREWAAGRDPRSGAMAAR